MNSLSIGACLAFEVVEERDYGSAWPECLGSRGIWLDYLPGYPVRPVPGPCSPRLMSAKVETKSKGWTNDKYSKDRRRRSHISTR